MDTETNQPILRSLQTKLHPSRFTAMSSKMAAIVGCILGEQWTNPRLVELVQTSDGFVLGRSAGDCGHNDFIGTAADLENNWARLLNVADLTEPERDLAEDLHRQTVRRV